MLMCKAQGVALLGRMCKLTTLQLLNEELQGNGS